MIVDVSNNLTAAALKETLDGLPGAVFAYKIRAGHDLPIFVNQEYLDLVGAGNLDDFLAFLDGDVSNGVHPDDVMIVGDCIERLSTHPGSTESYGCRLITMSGAPRLIRVVAKSTLDEDGDLLIVNYLMDLGVQENAPDAQNLDPLTGLIDMQSFLINMDNQGGHRDDKSSRGELAVLYVNLSNFRSYNLQHGMAAGDMLLRTVAENLRRLLPYGMATRFDSDHFVVLTDDYQLKERAEQIRLMVRGLEDGSLDCRIGACVWDNRSFSAEVVCDNARIACDDTRNRPNTYYAVYNDAMGKQLETSEYVVSHLSEALACGWIKVYYQPIIRAISGRMCAMEALARWDDPERGLLRPVDFIKPLEDAHQIWRLDLYMVEQVIMALAKHIDQRTMELPVSVNLSRFDFVCCDIFDRIESLMRRYQVPRNLLRIEVTESAMASAERETIFKALDKLRKAGYSVWMDDFGSGYSSLNLLGSYSFELIKLDMGFLLSDSPRSRHIVTAIVAMDKHIGTWTLAEGVEAAEQAEFLRNLGCDKLQGFYFGKPLPLEQTLDGCRSRGIGIETPKERNFYDALKPINFLTDVPMAVGEYCNDSFCIYFMNEAARKILREDGYASVDEVVDTLNNANSPAYREFVREGRYAAKLKRSGEILSPFHGHQRLIRYRYLANYDDHYMFEAHIYKHGSTDEQLPPEAHMLMNLRFFYRSLFEIDVERGTIQSITFGSAKGERATSNVTALMVDGCPSPLLPPIFEADKRRYAAFIDPRTLKDRLDQTGTGVLSGTFRTVGRHGTLSWLSHRIVQVPSTDGTHLLYAIRTTDAESVESESRLLASSPYTALVTGQPEDLETMRQKAALWDDLTLHIPLGFFWKDREGKLLGASKCFLDYYGIDSVDGVLGTEVGPGAWRADGELVRQDDRQVLEEGARLVAVPGRCLVNGTTHNVAITKWPLYRRGEICGVMGYFFDEEAMLWNASDHERPRLINRPVGIETTAQFVEDFARLESDYVFNQVRFGIVFARVNGLRQIQDSYGHELLESVRYTIGVTVSATAGSEGSATAIGKDVFAILMEYDSPSELEAKAYQLRQGIEAIHEVDGIRVTLFAKVWTVDCKGAMGIERRIMAVLGDLEGELTGAGCKNGLATDCGVMQGVLDLLPIGCCILGPDRTILYWNKKAEEMVGYSAGEMVGGSCPQMTLGCSYENGTAISCDDCPVAAVFKTGQVQTMHMIVASKGGRPVPIRNILAPLRMSDGHVREVVSFSFPLHGRDYDREFIRSIYETATLDAVTALPGRKYMEAYLGDCLNAYRRTGRLFAVLFADVDDLHTVNNVRGHATGDEVLKAFARSLRESSRKADKYSRWGGDEFVGVLQIKASEDVEAIGKRMLALAEDSAIVRGAEKTPYRVSIGITVVREGDDANTIIARADRYMYQAKQGDGPGVMTDADAIGE